MAAGPGSFLCGCRIPKDADVVDLEGFRVCATHGQREYGWRSPLRPAKTQSGREPVWNFGAHDPYAKLDFEGVAPPDHRSPSVELALAEARASVSTRQNGSQSLTEPPVERARKLMMYHRHLALKQQAEALEKLGAAVMEGIPKHS